MLFRWFVRLFVLSLMVSCSNVDGTTPWPDPSGVLLSSLGATDDERDIVPDLPVCVGSPSWSAGELGRTILYRYKREGRRLSVGYFVYWTTERPWGTNLLSYSFLPAFFIDAFYSHLFFLFPGMQRIIHGPGDIEGARVVYEQQDDGHWKPVSAVADDGLHREIVLSPDEFVDRNGRVVLMTDVWSHQLGARGARGFFESHTGEAACYGGAYGRGTMAPLTGVIAGAFRLGSPSDPRRAAPAWGFARAADATVAAGNQNMRPGST
jgi:hypothetical protein